MNNIEKIKAMDTEELILFLLNFHYCTSICKQTHPRRKCSKCTADIFGMGAKKDIKQWLESEAL
jgi:hypothetical protein